MVITCGSGQQRSRTSRLITPIGSRIQKPPINLISVLIILTVTQRMPSNLALTFLSLETENGLMSLTPMK
jgi:hypothetical protein